MTLDIPPELKKIAPYIKRAEELDKDTTTPESRLVAYYLRQYAVQMGISLAGSSTAKVCLGQILGDLEVEKPKMDNFTREEAAFLCRQFAMNVFNKADNEDRAGLAGKGTAKTFYAAQSFLQILDQFNTDGTVDPDQVAEDKKRIIYCKWKATEILKAIKEGREPTPGGYGEDVLDSIEETPETEEVQEIAKPVVVETITNDNDDFGLPVAPTNIPPPLNPKLPPNSIEQEYEQVNNEEGTEVELGPPPAYSSTNVPPPTRSDRPTLSFDLPPMDIPTPSSQKPKPSIFGGFMKKAETKQSTKAQIADALELTRFALAALEDKDGDLAAERLQQALTALGR